MNEQVNQPEQDNSQISNALLSIAGSLSNQPAVPAADSPNESSPYEDSPVPYLPLPSKSTPQSSPSSGAASQGADSSSSSLPAEPAATSSRIGGVGVLIGIALGAALGGVFGHFTGGSMVMWGSIGAVVGGVIALLPYIVSEGDVPWLLSEGLSVGLDGLFDCCLTSAIFVIASIVMIGGLLFWHSLLLAALAGGSIMTMLLIGMSLAFWCKTISKVFW